MASYNHVVLMGNLTRDPQVRTLGSGTAVVDLGLAANEKYRNREGQQVERTCFVDVVAWGRQAETCRDYLTKGSSVLVEGRLQFDQWEKDGEKRSRLRVRAERVHFIGRTRGSGAGRGGEHAAAPAPGPTAAALPEPAADESPF